MLQYLGKGACFIYECQANWLSYSEEAKKMNRDEMVSVAENLLPGWVLEIFHRYLSPPT